MKVLKFGGTSVGSIENLIRVKEIITSDHDKKVVVCSAMSGVTDQLVALADASEQKEVESVKEIINKLHEKHISTASVLLEKYEVQKNEVISGISSILEELSKLVVADFTATTRDEIVTFGERILTFIFSSYLAASGVTNQLLDAKEFMHVDQVDNPNINQVSELLNGIISKQPTEIYITQGFVCRDQQKQITTLKRGGSDYSATIIGAAVLATEVQIWTDIDGLHNNDPRFVEDTYPISSLTYNEAAELAYFGAKILHPQTVSPIASKNIPVFLKNTFEPQAQGTVISNQNPVKGLKAISAKDGITAIKIKSNRMLMAHGYLKHIFEIFDNNQTSIDMITTSEVAISLTIDNTSKLAVIRKELEACATEVAIDQNQSIICIVGEAVIEDQKAYKLFEILNELPVRMISYGGSRNNISLLVNTEDKIKSLQFLNQKLFIEGVTV